MTTDRDSRPTLELDAMEIRLRAERRVGELMAEQSKKVGLNQRSSCWFKNNSPKDWQPTLNEAGIDKHLAHRARRTGDDGRH